MSDTAEVMLGPSGKPIAPKYVEAIKYLTEHPDEICHAWYACYDDPHPAHCLFQYLTPTGEAWKERSKDQKNDYNNGCEFGCLTQVRGSTYNQYAAWTPELTERIKLDERLPKSAASVRVEDLPLFGEYQTEFDETIRKDYLASLVEEKQCTDLE